MTIDDTISDVRPWVRPGALRTAALVMGSAGAAAIHFSMIPAHADESTALAVGFAVVAWLQAAFAVAVLVRPTRGLLASGAVLNLSALSIWAWSRLFGLPLGIGGGGVEAVDTVDALCALLEVAVITAAVWPSAKTERSRARPAILVAGALASVLVVAATSAVLAAPASHDHGHAEAHDDTARAAGKDTHNHDSSAAHDDQADISTGSGEGAGHQHATCTAPVTSRQQAAADQLVTDTRATLDAYESFDAAVAEGFVNITPEGQLVVHYARPQRLVDRKVLDASAPESLVYAFPQRTGPVLLGAMYLMGTAANPPTPGGCLTQWHHHQNLCISPGEGMVAVVRPDGSCPLGSSNESTQSMMHVWRYDTSAGPFAELRAIDPVELRAAVVAELRG